MSLRYLLGLWLLFASWGAHAQSFEDGYQSYVKNLFPVAELQFKNALKKAGTNEDKAFILKFIGICQYMRGDKKNAQTSFSQSLSLDRNVQIDQEEVLDPSVVTFFNGIKSRMPAPKVAKKEPEKKYEPAPTYGTQSKNGSKTAKKKKSKKKNEGSVMAIRDGIREEPRSSLSVLQFMPFGVPQFHDSSYIWGSGYAAGQLFALYSALDTDKQISERRSLNQVVRTKEGLTEEQRETFFRENAAFMNDLKGQKSMALAAFGALWTASVIHSLVIEPRFGKKVSEELPREPRQELAPVFVPNEHGGAIGLSFRTELK